ncbi:conserved hypothetical protein [Deferribacter desulfuricans SSM1]|uniref:SHOCT domain-containing protein n=1 Tax=Deferribacter desulfuricans (strain DSM 14783 / JCM 11476 / NBRC 101012 / SSM1) TaxID=639282 RepID=D3PB35_DEFDS|nr:hypothetical protein [Deferribacter desulfuricans]BAI79808.1 conserved hypothetical protein [Deferribacter desulfuricans SSM1]
MYGYRWFGFMWMFKILVWILIIVGFVLFLIIIVRSFGGIKQHDKAVESKRLLEILKERYAKGEIDRDVYLKMKKDLES